MVRLSRPGHRFALSILLWMLVLPGASAVVNAEDATPANSDAPAKLIFVNALTALDKVDVYLNGDESEQRVLEGLDYGATSDELEGTAPGTVIVIRQNVNWGVDRDLFNTMIPTEPGHTYVVVITDFFVIPVELDLSEPRIGNARTIGIHAAAEVPPVDVYASEASRRIPLGTDSFAPRFAVRPFDGRRLDLNRRIPSGLRRPAPTMSCWSRTAPRSIRTP